MSAEHNRVRLRLPREGFELAVDLQLPGDGITVLFGASGSGKTSVLRCVAGLERPLEAVIRIAGETWQDDDNGVFLPTWRRALGYVFQESTLFPHLDVRGNLEYGLRRAGKPQVRGMLDSAVELLGIGDLLARRVERLSGGERQRVAIARALATAPRLLVLDEPLSSLDQARRREILPWLERLRDELRTPMLYVTHFADEVAKLADHLVVLERGQVRASAPAAEVLSRIIDPVLLGDDAGALLEGVVAARDEHWQLIRVAFAGGDIWLRDTGLPCGHAVRLRILARDVSITTAEPRNTSIQNHFPCVIDSMAPDTHPSQVLVRAACGESMLLARITGKAVEELRLRPGGTAWLQVKSVALIE